MSADSGINAALLNMCAQVQGDAAARQSSREGIAESTSAAATGGSIMALPSAGGAVSLSAPADGTATPAEGETPEAPRSAADYEWLRNALASVEAPEKRIKMLLLIMERAKNGGESDSALGEERLDALVELSDMLEDINWATEFALMNGPQRVLEVLRRERAAHPIAHSLEISHDSTAAATSEAASPSPTAPQSGDNDTLHIVRMYDALSMVVAHSAQLNEPLQAAYQAGHWEDILLPLTTETIAMLQAACASSNSGKSHGEMAATWMRSLASMFHASSCLCRGCVPNSIVFVQNGGLTVMADALRLTLTMLQEEAVGGESLPERSNPMAVATTISSGPANGTAGDEQDNNGVRSPLRSAAIKVTARVLFFAAALTSSGVARKDLIQLTCLHAEVTACDEMVQKAAALALSALVVKSAKTVKDAVHTLMPRRLEHWRRQRQRVEGADAEEDERQQFVDALDKVG